MAGSGVFWVTCRPENAFGRNPSLAATKVILEVERRKEVAEPNIDTPTISGIMTKPTLPRVATPKGCMRE